MRADHDIQLRHLHAECREYSHEVGQDMIDVQPAVEHVVAVAGSELLHVLRKNLLQSFGGVGAMEVGIHQQEVAVLFF